MYDTRVSALAVVNENGQLASNLSASDLKEVGFDLDLYVRLFDSVQDFLKKKTLNRNVVRSDVRQVRMPPGSIEI